MIIAVRESGCRRERVDAGEGGRQGPQARGLPLATIRRFVELVRHRPGNEDERLDLMRRHEQQVIDRMR